MEIVRWYIDIMEQGMDTKSLMEEYLKVKKELDQVRNILQTKDAKHQEKIKKVNMKNTNLSIICSDQLYTLQRLIFF